MRSTPTSTQRLLSDEGQIILKFTEFQERSKSHETRKQTAVFISHTAVWIAQISGLNISERGHVLPLFMLHLHPRNASVNDNAE